MSAPQRPPSAAGLRVAAFRARGRLRSASNGVAAIALRGLLPALVHRRPQPLCNAAVAASLSRCPVPVSWPPLASACLHPRRCRPPSAHIPPGRCLASCSVASLLPAERTMASLPVALPVQHAPALPADLKRKRSPSHDQPPAAPLPKAAKTHNHLQINYLARHLDADLPLVTNDDTLPNILALLGDYQGVLDRHESMACNLGARPLGPILIKRFERLFDGPPRVLKSHGKDGTSVSWLDVVEFARNKPEQFQLGQMSEGVRVCQFYTRQCRVQISEEDFVLISSGIPQKMIPPQPIIEDEEKELGTIEILEKNLGQICQLADQGES